VLLLVGRSDAARCARLAVYIVFFAAARDAMTPEGMWRVGAFPGTKLGLCFTADSATLVALGCLAMLLTLLLVKLDPANGGAVSWTATKIPVIDAGSASAARHGLRSIVIGVVSGVVVAFAVHTAATGMPPFTGVVTGLMEGRSVAAGENASAASADAVGAPSDRRSCHFGRPSPAPWAVVFLALAGNLYEEVLFRGFLQPALTAPFGSFRATCLSALGFGLAHSFLTVNTVTLAGAETTHALLLGFTLLEGAVCAMLAPRWGVLSAAAAHGTIIAILALQH